ncbi:unnamed protein product [Auanema sp. JU1783]|nr:unnamed protein product [Auanema sp. JU1783]
MSASSGGGFAVENSTNNPVHSSGKYKTYVQAVDKALRTFENPNEWADLISALGRLARVFQSNAKFGDIPKPVLVAKRLSQCLHPALPMGVHLKALETYRQIFDILGPQLPKLLYLFTVGLFPLMDHCGIKVKTELFNLFEQYLVPMNQHLRPALPGFLAGVLLGLEEGTEFYDRSLKLLDRVCDGVGEASFFACLWQAVLGSPSVRLPAMLYVNVKFDKSRSLDDQLYIIGDHINHMVSALSATADDTGSPLVQRYLLDFLCAAFPLDSTSLTKDDFVQLLQRCIFVVLRRDMSLNRRLYTWLISPTGGTVAVSGLPVGDDRLESSFFKNTVLPMTVDALHEYLKLDTVDIPQSSTNNWAHGWGDKKDADQQQFVEVRVCRLLTYLQDRPDIGRPLLDRVLPLLLSRCAQIHPELKNIEVDNNLDEEKIFDKSAMRLSLNSTQGFSPKPPSLKQDDSVLERRITEMSKMLNVLLGSLENGFIWSFLAECFSKNMEEPTLESLIEYSKIVAFCLRSCALDTETDIRHKYIPQLLNNILSEMKSKLCLIHKDAVIQIMGVCTELLGSMSAPAVVETDGEASEASAHSTPVKRASANTNTFAKDQYLVESCLSECLSLLGSACELYCLDRTGDRLPVFYSICDLLTQFAEYPIFCSNIDEYMPSDLPKWCEQLLNVINADEWLTQMTSTNCSDLPARTTALAMLVSMYIKAGSVLSQHSDIRGREAEFVTPSNDEVGIMTRTVLLKPLLSQYHLNLLESLKLFEKCAQASWLGLSSEYYASEHSRLAKLLSLLHARKLSEASSDVENIIVSSLTNNDQVISTDAARTFHRFWTLTRLTDGESSIVSTKPFHRAVMLLLGVLADESVSRGRAEIKSVAVSWFIDCANHNDLPRIVQMLSTMLMNPATARVSIQYLWKESKLTREQFSSLPSDASAVTLVTADGKQRLYHLEGSILENSWHGELRNRLLLKLDGDNTASDTTPPSVCANGDVPNFDDDTDSLDTLSLSLEGIDPAVIETIQHLIDCVVEDDSNEIDLDHQYPDATEDSIAPDDNVPVVFRAGSTDVDNEPPGLVGARSESKEKSGDSVNRIKKGHRRQDSLQESIFSMTEKELKAFDATDLLRPSAENENLDLFHELHVHMLLYGESGRVVDLGRAETAFRILTALLSPRSAPVSNRMLLNCLVSSGTASQSGEPSSLSCSLVDLMAKHVRAILGQHFWGSNEDDHIKHRHLTLLELLITISLHFLRSFFLNSPVSPVTDSDLIVAWKCKVSALDFLSQLFGDISDMIVEQHSRPFASFIQSILSRAKLQKCLLHLLFYSVHDPKSGVEKGATLPLSVSISEFNEGFSESSRKRLSGLLSAYNRSLLAFTAQAIRLEYEIKMGLDNFSENSPTALIHQRISKSQELYNTASHRLTIRDPHPSLVELRAFLLIVLNALKRHPDRHEIWFQFVVEILPWMERSLATVVVRVAEQLCKNLDIAMSKSFKSAREAMPSDESSEHMSTFPAHFMVSTMEALTTLIHYCVVDTATNVSPVHPPQITTSTAGTTSMVGQAISIIPGTKGATELFTNIVKAFSFSESQSHNSLALSKMEVVKNGGPNWRQAKNDMLTSLPHCLATICDVWSVVRSGENPKLPLGNPAQLRRLVIDLLSPIAQNHQQAFLQALSLVWLTRSACGSSPRKSDPDQLSFTYTTSQLDVANLLLSLKIITIEELMTSVCESLKEAGIKASKLGSQADKATFPTEAPLLELVHACIRSLPIAQMRQCWTCLQTLFSEAPLTHLPPRAIFLLFIILCDFIRLCGVTYIVEDKSLSKAVQDCVQRMTEAVNVIVGWQLETTTWLKRTLVVKQDQSSSQDASPSLELNTPVNTPAPSITSSEQNSMRGSTLSLINRPASIDVGGSIHSAVITDKKSSSNLRGSVKDTNNNKRDPTHSTQALFLLAQNLTELVDSVCKSDDKEKLLPTLHAVWSNVVPYLRAKSARNARFFLASSQLLASMSSFNYMRPVWKKTTLELLLDSSFFKMDHQSLRQWLVVTDHLMTHDKTSFKDLLKSIAYTPNASFSIMTSKEQEYEGRAQSLKRLAFVVFGSELEQYQAQMNDIQERLSENLRASQSPSIRSAVFLCLRVLLIRLRPQSLVGIWPIMITELVHVLLQMEQHLSGENNGLDEISCAKDDAWLQLYLAACKLLETLCTLPAGYIPQFQMCHWAFINTISANKTDMFIPFAGRINKLLKNKYGKLTDEEKCSQIVSLGGIKVLTGFDKLRPFFYALATQSKQISDVSQIESCDLAFLTGSLTYKEAIDRLESALFVDFAENWQL